jgi:hypothetical protein
MDFRVSWRAEDFSLVKRLLVYQEGFYCVEIVGLAGVKSTITVVRVVCLNWMQKWCCMLWEVCKLGFQSIDSWGKPQNCWAHAVQLRPPSKFSFYEVITVCKSYNKRTGFSKCDVGILVSFHVCKTLIQDKIGIFIPDRSVHVDSSHLDLLWTVLTSWSFKICYSAYFRFCRWTRYDSVFLLLLVGWD